MTSPPQFDRRQWKALVRAYALVDYGAILGRNGRGEQRAAVKQFARLALLMGLMGLSPALIILISSDRLLAASVMVATTMMWTMLMLTGKVQQLVAPDDFMIVASRPVASSTYFAAKVTALGLGTVEAAWLTGWPSVAAFGVRGWGDPVLMTAAAFSIVVAAAVTLAGMTAFYGWMMRVLSPAIVEKALAVITTVGMLLVMGATIFAFVEIGDAFASGEEGHRLAQAPWIGWLPTTWFAAPVMLASGAGEMRYLAAAAAALGVLGLGMAVLLGSIGRGYSSRVAAIVSRSAGPTRGPGAMTTRLRGELRAAYLLFRAHLRGELAFQLATMMHFIMVAVVLLIDTNGELPRDPFLTPSRQRPPGSFMMSLGWLALAAFHSMMTSTEHEASWLWFTTPGRRVEQVRALEGLTILFGVGLPLILVWVYFSFAYGSVFHSLLQTLFAAGLGLTVAQVVIAWKPALPFSRPLQERNAMYGFFVVFPMGMLSLPLALLLYTYSYRSYVNVAVTLAVLLAVNLALRWLTQGMLQRRSAQITYRG